MSSPIPRARADINAFAGGRPAWDKDIVRYQVAKFPDSCLGGLRGVALGDGLDGVGEVVF
jgi:hypothetical protein